MDLVLAASYWPWVFVWVASAFVFMFVAAQVSSLVEVLLVRDREERRVRARQLFLRRNPDGSRYRASSSKGTTNTSGYS